MYVFIVAYAGLFRIEGVIHNKQGDISIYSDHVTINVYKRKADQLRKGSQVVISERSTIATCSVKIFRRHVI